MKTVFLTLLFGIVLAGCGGNEVYRESVAGEFVYEKERSWDQGIEITVRDDSDISAVRELSREQTDRTMIYHAYFQIGSLYPDSVHEAVAHMAQEMEGFILERTKEQTVIRVPAARLDEANVSIEQLGKVLDKRIIGEDVTDQHYDLKIRLENSLKSRERYLALLEKAVSVGDILKIERELDRLNKEIDQLKGKLNRMSHMVEYVKITVRTSPGTRPGPVGWVFYQMYQGAKWLFVRD